MPLWLMKCKRFCENRALKIATDFITAKKKLETQQQSLWHINIYALC